MRSVAVVLTLVLAAPLMAGGQSTEPEMAAPDATQQQAAKTFAAKPGKPMVKPPANQGAKAVALTPLTPRERVVQLLDRFSYGPKPGQVDRVLAQGADNWLNLQMDPDKVPDDRLQKRLADYPTITMTPAQALDIFPDRNQITAVAQGKVPYPNDPLLNAVYEVQIYKLQQEDADRKARAEAIAKNVPYAEPTDEQKAAQKKQDKAAAASIFGELYALPKNERMAALIKMPVEDRAIFTGDGNLSGDQRNQLIADLNPRERETFLAMASRLGASYHITEELAQARVVRDVLTERQLQAVMTNFWFNHFNIYAPKDSDQWYTASYERDVIRAHALGNFRDLLLATSTSPAMMVYLDNWLSIGPDSIANGVDPKNPNAKKGSKGLNENYGREVMELHTVGVNGGYTQADVTALSAILTGWGVDRVNQGGGFMFDPKRHDPGPKLWLGHEIADDGTLLGKDGRPLPAGQTFGPSNVPATPESMRQGIVALAILAQSPQTAHFISYLLAQYFVSDNPPPALVDRLQKTFLASKGDIKTVLRALIASPEFNSRQYYRNKVKTPEEFVASAFRATNTDPQNPGAMVGTIRTMGMPLYNALPPTGYYLTADQWMNSAALIDRLNFAYALTNGKYANQKFDAPQLLATGLLTPSTAGDLSGFGAVKPVAAGASQAKLMGVAAPVEEAAPSAAPAAGAQVALHVLEATMIGAPVSAQTNQLINKQMQQLGNQSPTDTLNLLTALVMGSPEFQLR